MEYELIGGTHDLLLNKTLADAMQKNLEMVGGVSYTPGEIEFGKKLQSTFNFTSPAIESAAEVKPLKTTVGGGQGSTDVGDVSYAVPTVGLEAATWIPGTPAHSWQAVACGGTDIGIKGMMVAAKTMSLTAFDLFTTPTLIANAKEELKRIEAIINKALLGDRKPALNYRINLRLLFHTGSQYKRKNKPVVLPLYNRFPSLQKYSVHISVDYGQ
jgi:aminobenzoyl-glutamate utilization protein B